MSVGHPLFELTFTVWREYVAVSFMCNVYSGLNIKAH